MSIEDRIADYLEDPERRARGIQWVWWISMVFLLFGYGYIGYVLLL